MKYLDYHPPQIAPGPNENSTEKFRLIGYWKIRQEWLGRRAGCERSGLAGLARGYRSWWWKRALPREIASQSSFDVTLAPGSLQVYLSFCCIGLIRTAFPINEFKGILSLVEPTSPLL